jgi:Growth-arrest specific micro-tubule binding
MPCAANLTTPLLNLKYSYDRKLQPKDFYRKKNERAFTEIKNYYNDITLNNLAMIRDRSYKTFPGLIERKQTLSDKTKPWTCAIKLFTVVINSAT